MDGIETVQKIREMGGKYESLTIVALTANAIAGVREMFLQNGFDDFISKPIDAEELQEIVSKHLPPGIVHLKEHSEEQNNARDGNKDELNNEILEFFFKRLTAERDKMSAYLESGDFKLFAITVHAMKSSLATINEKKLSETAAKLEAEAKADNREYCTEQFPAFAESLTELHEKLKATFPEEQASVSKEKGDPAHLAECVAKAVTAADDFESESGLELVKALSEFDFGEEINNELEKAKTAFEDFDCTGAAESLARVNVLSGVV
jgi:HPt (histidine-containing phosphotransfer) domain-containing protein